MATINLAGLSDTALDTERAARKRARAAKFTEAEAKRETFARFVLDTLAPTTGDTLTKATLRANRARHIAWKSAPAYGPGDLTHGDAPVHLSAAKRDKLAKVVALPEAEAKVLAIVAKADALVAEAGGIDKVLASAGVKRDGGNEYMDVLDMEF